MKSQRARKALAVNRREELYPEALLQKERSRGKTAKGSKGKKRAQPSPRIKPAP